MGERCELPLAVARAYRERGWIPIPVPHREKAPTIKGWQHMRLTAEQLPAYFNGQPLNIGGLLGAPSGNLVEERPATGWPTVVELLGRSLVGRLAHWLELPVRRADRDSWFARFPPMPNRANQETAKRKTFTPLVDLLAEPEETLEWVVDGLLPRGRLSLIAAKPKVGKATTTRAAALAVARGVPFLGRATTQGTVLLCCFEEKRSQVAKHFRRMGATDEPIHVWTGTAPDEALGWLIEAITHYRPVLVVIDPVAHFVRVRDGNDYTEVIRTLEPVIELARTSGSHLLLVHHLGKGDRSGADAVLGSTGWFASVDTALLLRRRDQCRVIGSLQRYGEDLPETVLTLTDNGWVDAGADYATMQLQTMGEREPTERQLREELGGNESLVGKALRYLVEQGRVERVGGGRKGDPYLYRASRPTG